MIKNLTDKINAKLIKLCLVPVLLSPGRHIQLCWKCGESVGNPQAGAVPQGQPQWGAVTDPVSNEARGRSSYRNPERSHPLIGAEAFSRMTQPMHGDSVGRKVGDFTYPSSPTL